MTGSSPGAAISMDSVRGLFKKSYIHSAFLLLIFHVKGCIGLKVSMESYLFLLKVLIILSKDFLGLNGLVGCNKIIILSIEKSNKEITCSIALSVVALSPEIFLGL